MSKGILKRREKMKKLFKWLLPFLMVFMLLACDQLLLLLGEEEEEEGNVIEQLVDNFLDEVFTPSRALTEGDRETIKADIIADIESEGLSSSTDVAALMPTVAASAQVSISVVVEASEVEGYFAVVSKAAVVVASENISDSISDTAIIEMVSDISSEMVSIIVDCGLTVDDVQSVTEVTVAALVEVIDEVELPDAEVINAVAEIALEASTAVVEIEGITAAIIESTMASVPAAAVESFDTSTLTTTDVTELDTIKAELIDAAVDSVMEAALEVDTTEFAEFVITDFAAAVADDLTTDLETFEEFADIASSLEDEILESIVDTVIEDGGLSETDLETALGDIGDALAEAGVIEDTSEFDDAITTVENEQALEELGDTDTLTAAQLVEQGETFLQNGGFAEAYEMFSEAKTKADAASEELDDSAKIWWSMLTLANMIVSDEVQGIYDDMGIIERPTTITEVLSDDINIFVEEEVVDTWYDEFDNEYTETDYITVFPAIRNESEIAEDMGEDSDRMMVQLIAMLYNLQEAHPTGMNSVIDSLIAATDAIDDVITMLETIEDTASISYEYSFFEDEPYSEDSEWPGELVGDATTETPMVVNVGKAEVHAIVAVLELVRTVAKAGQSIDMSIDLAGYWTDFNPIDGAAYVYSTDETTGETVFEGLDENYDWSMLSNPLEEGMMMARETATDYLTESKTYFLSALNSVKSAQTLLAARTTTDDFFISPSNAQFFDTDTWDEITGIAELVVTYVDLVIDSATNDTFIYIPTDDTMLMEPDTWSDVEADGYIGVNFYSIFEEPLLALDSFIAFDGGEPMIFVASDTATTGFALAETLAPEGTATEVVMSMDTVYYIKIMDVMNETSTLFDMVMSLMDGDSDGSESTTTLADVATMVGNDIYVPVTSLADDPTVLAAFGSSLSEAGTILSITYEDEEDGQIVEVTKIYESTGSFFTIIARELLTEVFSDEEEEEESSSEGDGTDTTV